MRKITLQLTTLLLTTILLFSTSCGSDGDGGGDEKIYTVDGSWKVYHHALETNYPDFDERVNGYFVNDTAVTVHSFNDLTKEAVVTMTKIGEILPISRYVYKYSTTADSIFLFGSASLDSLASVGTYKAGSATLQLRYRAEKVNLKEILHSVNIDHNILDGYPGINGDEVFKATKQK